MIRFQLPSLRSMFRRKAATAALPEDRQRAEKRLAEMDRQESRAADPGRTVPKATRSAAPILPQPPAQMPAAVPELPAVQTERDRIKALAGVAEQAARLGVGFDLNKAIANCVTVRAARNSVMEQLVASDESVGDTITATSNGDPESAKRARNREAWRRGIKGEKSQQLLR